MRFDPGADREVVASSVLVPVYRSAFWQRFQVMPLDLTMRRVHSELTDVRRLDHSRQVTTSSVSSTDLAPRTGTVLSLFAGAGGLDVGLEAAGFKTLGYVEIDNDCRTTLELNRPSWTPIEPCDAIVASSCTRPRDLGLRVGELDVIAAGPPCQPFSSAAQWHSSGRLGMADKRAATVWAMVDFVRTFRPKVLLIENVVGFVHKSNGAMSVLQQGLDEVNHRFHTKYALRWEVVDAADYGVPQRRRRAIVTACRDGGTLTLPEPTHRSAPLRAWDALGDLTQPSETPLPLGTWAHALLPSVPEGGNYQWLTAEGGGEELFGYRTRYWSFLLKLARNRPSWTLSASPGPSTGPFHWDNRQLTVHERMRLQSFPDSWRLVGSTRSQIRMVGNATPPLLAEVIGRAVLQRIHNSSGVPRPLELLLTRKRSVPNPVEPLPLPKHVRSLVGSKPAHPGTGRGPSPRRIAD